MQHVKELLPDLVHVMQIVMVVIIWKVVKLVMKLVETPALTVTLMVMVIPYHHAIDIVFVIV